MDEFERFYRSAVNYLSYRPRSIQEVRQNLGEKIKKIGYPEEKLGEIQKVVDQVIKTLVEQKFLNDTTFATLWVEQRARFKPKSQRVLQMELKQKGISPEIITAVLSSEEIQAIANDYTQAKALVEKKIGKYIELPRQEIYQKLGGFLGRRGFSWTVIKRSIDDTLASQYNT